MATTNFITRTKRDKDFTILSNDIFEKNGDISLKALGLLCYLLHLPNDWKVSREQLSKQFKDGKQSINSSIEELVKIGYVLIKEKPRKKGQFTGYQYFVYDYPQGIQPQTENPTTVNPITDKPTADSKLLQRTKEKRTNNKKELNTNIVFKENEYQINGKLIIDLHYEWFKKNNNGIPPKIDGAQGKAAKELYTYLVSVVKSKNEEISSEEMPLKIHEVLTFIFINWHKLDSFNQKQVKITQINSNITNIINDLKKSRKINRQTEEEYNNTGKTNFDVWTTP